MNEDEKGLLFTLEHFSICCPAKNMIEVKLIPAASVREIPGVRTLLRGMFVYHDVVLPLINLALLFHIGERKRDIIPVGVMKTDDGHQFGLIIDEKTEIIDFTPSRLQEMDRAPRGMKAEFFLGYIQSYGKMIFVLSINSFIKYLVARKEQ